MNIKNIKQIIILIFIVVVIVISYFAKEKFFANNQKKLEDKDNSLYADFVSRNPIVESYKDSNNDGIDDWNDAVNSEFGKNISFEKSDEDPRNFNTNLTDLIASDIAVASTYIKNGKSNESVYDGIMDNLLKMSRPIAPELDLAIQTKYTNQEEKQYLKNIEIVYSFILNAALPVEILGLVEKDTLNKNEIEILELNLQSMTTICKGINSKITLNLLDKYVEEHKSLLQTCHDTIFVVHSILNKDKDPARAITGVSLAMIISGDINKNIAKIKSKMLMSVADNKDFTLFKK